MKIDGIIQLLKKNIQEQIIMSLYYVMDATPKQREHHINILENSNLVKNNVL